MYLGSPVAQQMPAMEMVPPPRVVMALNFLSFLEEATRARMGEGMNRSEGRELDPSEQHTREAALQVLRLYFQSEQDFAQACPARARPPDAKQGGTEPVPVPQP